MIRQFFRSESTMNHGNLCRYLLFPASDCRMLIIIIIKLIILFLSDKEKSNAKAIDVVDCLCFLNVRSRMEAVR